MRRTIATLAGVGAALIGAGPAWALGDTGTHEVGHYAGALAPFDGGGVRGIVELEARPGGATRARGVLIGLLLPAVQPLRLALSDQSCGSADADYAPLAAPLQVRPDGTALMEEEGIFYGRVLRKAVSLALLEGPPDQPVPVACAPLRRFRADPTPRERDDVLLSAARLTPGPAVLGNLLAEGDGPAEGATVLAGLQPETRYGLELSEGACDEAGAGHGVPAGSVVTGTTGAAYTTLAAPAATGSGLRAVRSLLVRLPDPDASIVVCAPARAAGVRRDG